MTETATVIPDIGAFEPFPSIHRLSRDMVVTEKIDGTNAQIIITEQGSVYAGSRNRYLTVEDDNFGFAKWVQDHAEELRALGPGRHFGEWWGAGIQRRYGLNEKRFSLFNVSRWTKDPGQVVEGKKFLVPECVHVVPILLKWTFETGKVDEVLSTLSQEGSRAAPGFMQPEGVVVFHVPSGTLFKKTLDKNDGHKGS